MTAIYDLSLKAKNFGNRGTSKIEFIVLHDTAGSGTVNDAKYLANDPEHRGISVDFCVPKDGTIYQLNHNLKTHFTFHAGRATAFRGLSGPRVNSHSIGIEIAQKANMAGLVPRYPDIQVRAVAQICIHLCAEFNLTKNDITTHQKIITDGSRSDPRQFPWDDFWSYFNQNAGTELSAQGTITVSAGDTLYSLANKYNTTVERIKATNGLNSPSNLITVGQILKIGD